VDGQATGCFRSDVAAQVMVNLHGILSMLRNGEEIAVDGLRGEVRRLAP
jgi:hypothetical protein